MASSNPPIGLSSATDNDPNTSDKFSFWLVPHAIVNPFDIVQADQVGVESGATSQSFGVVLELEHRTDAPSHLANFISNDFGTITSTPPNTPRLGTTIAKCGVLNNDANVYMPIGNERIIRFANEAGIHLALGIDTMPEERRIPAGLIQMSNGTNAVAYFDRDYILGPEAAHVNITGISGLATKTSYAMFLLQSILQKTDASKTAIILLNVKHGDLLMIDQAAEHLPQDQIDLWNALHLKPQPFENVHYLLPEGKETFRTGHPNSFVIPSSYQEYGYSLVDASEILDLLFSHVIDKHDTIDSLIGLIMEGIQRGDKKWADAMTWRGLLENEPLVKEGKPQPIGDVRAPSVGKFRRQARRIVTTRSSGLFVEQRRPGIVCLSEEIRKLRGGHTYVVDIARLQEEEQTLVFGDILRTIYELYAEVDDPDAKLPEKVIIFVDELNKYAPAYGGDSPIVRQVLDIAERGRSLGVILFSAQQFQSAVHQRVTGNAGTQVIGRVGAAELASANYRSVDDEIKQNLTRLPKGELVLIHSKFRKPLKVIFPKPAFRQ